MNKTPTTYLQRKVVKVVILCIVWQVDFLVGWLNISNIEEKVFVKNVIIVGNQVSFDEEVIGDVFLIN